MRTSEGGSLNAWHRAFYRFALYLQNKLAELILQGEVLDGAHIIADIKGKELTFTVERAGQPVAAAQ